MLPEGGASLDAATSEIVLAAASADSGVRLQVTITAATAAFELEGRLSRENKYKSFGAHVTILELRN